MKIYVASSWRNTLQPKIVAMLRNHQHDVYDFRAPAHGLGGFSWREIDPNWENWTPEEYREGLNHPVARHGFDCDMNALKDCDACVLVLPSGRSASFEFGFACGMGKVGAVIQFENCEPELMYSGRAILTNRDEILDWSAKHGGK